MSEEKKWVHPGPVLPKVHGDFGNPMFNESTVLHDFVIVRQVNPNDSVKKVGSLLVDDSKPTERCGYIVAHGPLTGYKRSDDPLVSETLPWRMEDVKNWCVGRKVELAAYSSTANAMVEGVLYKTVRFQDIVRLLPVLGYVDEKNNIVEVEG